MPAQTQIRLERPLKETLRGKIDRFSFDVGVLKDRPHRRPGKGMKSIAGGPARNIGRKPSGKTLSEVSQSARKQLGVNYLTQPFKGQRKNADAVKLVRVFWKLVFDKVSAQNRRRFENLLQAVVRNPILRADYGFNRSAWARVKGSNRKFIDTGQLFRAITARVRVRRVS